MLIVKVFVEDQLEVLTRDCDVHCFELARLIVRRHIVIESEVSQPLEQQVRSQRCYQLACGHGRVGCVLVEIGLCRARHVGV